MKKLLFSILILASLNVQAQKVNLYKDVSNQYAYCNIEPIVPNIGDTAHAFRLSINTFSDNQMDYCKIYWALRNDQGIVLIDGNYELSNDNYAAWVDKNYLYNYVANELEVNIQK